jgi:uncharacterized protein YndB with AHSA1/START domain
MSTVTTEPLVREVLIEATPETVFGFFTEPDKITRWLAESAVSDPRPGGVIEHVHLARREARLGRRFHRRGEFLEVEFPTRVVFTWGWEEEDLATPIGSSTVEVDLERVATGTLVRLTHLGLAAAPRADHDRGWAELLGELAEVVVSA